jgi:hypothetical protein
MRRMLAVVVWVTLAVSPLYAQLQMGEPGASDDSMRKLIAANNLELKGNSPFYLSMSFKLFDMNGNRKRRALSKSGGLRLGLHAMWFTCLD